MGGRFISVGVAVGVAFLAAAAARGDEAVAPADPRPVERTLSNGIELPAEWPPRSEALSDEPRRPPYLAAPPEVVPIDVGRQLFVDDFLISATTLERTFHRPEYFAGNPVLEPDRPWESRLEGGAEKSDGPFTAPFSDGVWYDPQPRDPGERFKLAMTDKDGTPFTLFRSPDGIHWTKAADGPTIGAFRADASPRVRPVLWTAADRDDRQRDDLQAKPELYNLDCVAYESLIVGLFTILQGDYSKAKTLPTEAARQLRDAGQPVRFRFRLTRGRLYSFWVTTDPAGASFGHLAGGGPAFGGFTDVPPAEDAGGWQSLFDGQSLAGWHASAKSDHSAASRNTSAGRWVVDDGAIIGSQDIPGNGGIILTDREFGDFEVVVEMNNDFGPDSGLFLRSTEDGKAYQAMIDYHAGGNLMGIYGEGLGGRPLVCNFVFGDAVTKIDLRAIGDPVVPFPILPEAWPAFWRHGEWNELRARIVGGAEPTITTWINGVKISEWTETEPRHPPRGRIALQVHGGGSAADYAGKFVRYRGIKVREIPAAK